LLVDGTAKGAINVNTRYLVLGDRPSDKSLPKFRDQFTNLQGQVQRFGTDTITVQKLLAQMGWKTEERSVEWAGTRGAGGEFRTRKPGQKPGAPAAAPAGNAPAAAPAAGGVDPFGGPPAAAPAAPAVDPFGAPPAAAPAAPAADPFAAPAALAPAAADPFATPPK
jgi:hypothetical protein